MRFGVGSGLFVQVIHAIEQGRGATLVLLREGRPTRLVAKIGAGLSGPEGKAKELAAISGVRSAILAHSSDRMESQLKQPLAGEFDTPPVGAGAVIRAGFAETRCPGILTKAGETLPALCFYAPR